MTALQDAPLTAEEAAYLARLAALPEPVTVLPDGRQKLSDAEVAIFLAHHARGDVTVYRLAREFGISHQHGYDLVHGKRRAKRKERGS